MPNGVASMLQVGQRSRGAGGGPPAAAAAALDPLETTSHPQYPSADDEGSFPWVNPDAIPFEHRGWDRDRRRVYAAMCRTGQPAARRHAFANCRDHVHVFRDSSSGEVALVPETCKDRFCLPCGQIRSHRIAEALEVRMKPAADKLLFVTLTVRGKPEQSLQSRVDALRDAWKALRRLDGWRDSVRGGALCLEVKWSATSGGHWHPHYHLIVEGDWIDKAWLSAAWRAVTGDSDQVDVQRIKDPRQALGYVTKYASKPLDGSFLRRRDLLDEAMRTLKGVRLCSLFGSWYGTPLREEFEHEETEVLTTWVYEGTTRDLGCRAERGDREARLLLARVAAVLSLRHTLAQRCRGSPAMRDSPATEDLSGSAG